MTIFLYDITFNCAFYSFYLNFFLERETVYAEVRKVTYLVKLFLLIRILEDFSHFACFMLCYYISMP